MNDHDDDQKPAKSARTWLPVSVFIGTSLAIAVPLLMIRRARSSALQTALKDSSSAPPRRVLMPKTVPNSTTHTLRHRRLRPTPISAQPINVETTSSASDFDSPSTGQLLSAVSKTDLNTAMLAGKALFIATCLVGVGACGMVYAVQKLMGVDNVPDFARRMRYWIHTYLPGLTLRIHCAPHDTENRSVDNNLVALDHENWTLEESDERLRRAYEEGGLPLLLKVASRETGIEMEAERAKRQRQIDAMTSSDSRP